MDNIYLTNAKQVKMSGNDVTSCLGQAVLKLPC